MVSISTVSDTRVVSVTTTSSDPDEARDISNSIADMAVTYLPKLMETNAPNIAERAIRPERKSSPSLVKNTAIGAMICLILALAVITVFYLLDDTLATAEDEVEEKIREENRKKREKNRKKNKKKS